MSDEKINDDTPTTTAQNDQTESTSPSKPFKPLDAEIKEVPTLKTKEVLAATGNDAAGNSYCEDSLDAKKDEYGLKKQDANGSSQPAVKADESKDKQPESPDVEGKADPEAENGATKKSLNPTAATFIFQSKDQGKHGRGGAGGNRPPRGGFQGGRGGARSGSPAASAPAFVPRTASFGRGGAAAGGPSGRPQQNRQVSGAAGTPPGVSNSDTGVNAAASGEPGVEGSKQAGGVGNREPRGYVPPPPTKRVSPAMALSVHSILLNCVSPVFPGPC